VGVVAAERVEEEISDEAPGIYVAVEDGRVQDSLDLVGERTDAAFQRLI